MWRIAVLIPMILASVFSLPVVAHESGEVAVLKERIEQLEAKLKAFDKTRSKAFCRHVSNPTRFLESLS